MRSLSLLVGLLPLLTSLISATALTYKLTANEKACFFTEVTKQDSKVAFYFAVCRSLPLQSQAALSCPLSSLQLSTSLPTRPQLTSNPGSIRRLLRRRLHRHQPSRTHSPVRRKGTSRRLCLHRPKHRLLLLLLLQHNVDLRRQNGRLRNRR